MSSSSSMVQYPRWKMISTVIICLISLAYAAPNLLSREVTDALAEKYSRWLPVHPVNLGLDLQGGSYLLLKVDLAAAHRDRMNNLLDSVRESLLKERIGYIDLRNGDAGITFTLRDPAALAKVKEIVADIDRTLTVRAEGEAVVIGQSEVQLKQSDRAIIGQSIEIVRRRIDETGTKEPLIQASGEDRILLQLPGVNDPAAIKQALGQTAKMTFHMVDQAASMSGSTVVPPGFMRVPSRSKFESSVVVDRRPALTGDMLVDAYANKDPKTNRAFVGFAFDSLGAKKFAEISRNNVGQRFAVVLDGQVITAPVMRVPILDGKGIIEGEFGAEEAANLALLLRAGALPAPLTVLEERTVGPGLGQDAVEAGKIAGIAGFLLICGYMSLTYGLFGLMAAFTLAINVVMIYAVLSLMGATLTLPGIAGIVLTMGMAVDANVLIFERIREETRAGRSAFSAVDAGYTRAMTSIIDANLTTIIAGILLYWLGSGPVRGFAVTLIIGVLTSMFCALMVTRLMVLLWLRRKRPSVMAI